MIICSCECACANCPLGVRLHLQLCCTSAVFDMNGPNKIMPSFIFLPELPSSSILFPISHECTRLSYCDEEQAAQQKQTSTEFHVCKMSYLLCLCSIIVEFQQTVHLPVCYMTDGLSHTAERPQP